MYADNEYKFIAVLNPKIDLPKLMNALGHLTAGLIIKAQAKDKMKFLTYKFNSSEVESSSISLYPFIVLKAKNNNQLKTLHQQATELGIIHNVFTDTMLGATAIEQMSNTKNANLEELIYFGIVLFGDSDKLATLTRKFSLFSV